MIATGSPIALVPPALPSTASALAVSPVTALPAGPVTAATAVGFSLVGVFLGRWLFGSSDEDDGERNEALESLAERLGTDADAMAITRDVNDLIDRLDSITQRVDLDRHAPHQISRSSTALERVIALESALETGQLAIRPPASDRSGQESSQDSPAGVDSLPEAAEEVEARLSPTAPVATELLDAVSSGANGGHARAALREAVEYIEAYAALERAVHDIDPSVPDIASRLRNQLDDRSGPVTSKVVAIADALDQCRQRAEDVETERKQLAEAMETLTVAATDEPHLDLDLAGGRQASTVERGRALASLARDGDLFQGEPVVPRAAKEVRQSVAPDSGTASDLLEGLITPAQAGDLTETLAAAVQLIDEGATNRGAIGDIEAADVRDLLQEVESRVAALEGPVASVLDRRLDDLRRILDNADPANRIGPYAVRQELRFYERQLLDTLETAPRSRGPSGGDGAPSDVTDRLDDVLEQRSTIESRFVDGRPDHNHSIPIHFLSLADDLRSEAEDLASRDEATRAMGLLDGVEAILNYVEQLYERNEYSVLLRRLRG